MPSTDRLLIRHKDDGRTIPFEVSVVGQVDEPGAARPRSAASPATSASASASRTSCARPRSATGSCSRTRPTSCSRPTPRPASCSSPTRSSSSPASSPRSSIGENFAKIITPETLRVALERWERVAADPTCRRSCASSCATGTAAPCRSRSTRSARSTGQGRFEGVHGSARDISERERLERELRDSEERYRSVIQSSPDLIWATNKAGPLRVRLGPRPRPPGLGPGARCWAARSASSSTSSRWRRPTTTGRALALEPGRHPDPSARHPPQGRVAAAVRGVVRRGRPRRRGRERLRHRARRRRARAPRARAARERGALPVPRRELARRHLRDGRGGRHHLLLGVGGAVAGLGAAGGRGPPLPGHRPHARPACRPAAGSRSSPAGGRDSRPGWRCWTRTASYRPFEVTASAMRIDGEFSGVHGSARDIRERERLERELRESEERYRYLVQSSPDLVWMTDEAGAVHVRVRPGPADPRLGAGGAARPLVRRPHARDEGRARRAGAVPVAPAAPHRGPPLAAQRPDPRRARAGDGDHGHRDGRARASSSGRTARPATSPSASGWSAASGARPRSSRRPRSARTSPASSTTRSPRPCSR